MKNNQFKFMKLAFLPLLFTALIFSSCASKTRFLTSKVAPAAQGTVKVTSDKNRNYVIDIEITNLSPSTRLTPASAAYVVWLISKDNAAHNLGQLNSDDDFMSKDLRAKFKTISSSKPVKIIITAENDPGIQYPSFSEVILTTENINSRR